VRAVVEYGTTDDYGVSRSTHTLEWVKAVQEHALDYLTVKRIVRNSIDYSFVAASKFRDDFPPEWATTPDKLSLASVPINKRIPNSVRPAPPAVLYAVPTQGWEGSSALTAAGKGSRRRLGNDRLAGFFRERGEVEVVAARHVLRDRKAEVSAARALRLQLEAVDTRQIALMNPQRAGGAQGGGADAIERDRAIVVKHGRGGRCRTSLAPRLERAWRQRGRADRLQEITSLHGPTLRAGCRAVNWHTLALPCLRVSSSSTTTRIWSG